MREKGKEEARRADGDFRRIREELYKKVLYAVFLVIFWGNICINADHGALPAISGLVRAKADIGNFEFGLLGSIVYAGLTLGASLASGIYSKGKLIRITLIISTICNAGCLILFSATSSLVAMIFIRGFIGFF